MSIAAFIGASALVVPSMGMREATELQRYLERWGDAVAAAALIEAVVRPDGTIQSCHTEVVVGHSGMAADMCRWFLNYRVKPGQLGDGTKVHSVIRAVTMGFEPGSAAAARVIPYRPSTAALTLSVNRLPKGVRAGEIQSAALRVEADGRVSECEAKSGASPDLMSLICGEARKIAMPVVIDESGHPVTYVRRLGITFELDRVPSS
jgi:hypothetical protein